MSKAHMITPRRYLPSISSLLALEALDRLGSASAAAKELSLTQGAISRQLQLLEQQMQVQLLLRDRKRLTLTPAAQEYVGQVRNCLQQLAKASLKLKANPAGGSLNLAILPAFGMHWLAPRLAQFATKHPEVTINLSTRLKPFDFATEQFDAAIHFGQRDWPGVEYLPIMDEQVVPVASPGLLAREPERAVDLLQFPLLHLETRADAWERWLAAQGAVTAMPRGMVFDQFSTMVQAAIHGLGVALLPEYLIRRELSDGQLAVAFGVRLQSLGSYFLVWPIEKSGMQPLVSFRNWIETQVRVST